MAPATKDFFASSKYAIAGASRDPKKIGNKVSTSTVIPPDMSVQASLDVFGAVSRSGWDSDIPLGSRGLLEELKRQLSAFDEHKRQNLGDGFCDVVKWYKGHGFEAVPIHPKESEVEELSTIASVFDLVDAEHTSLSVITPPSISLPIVKTSLLELHIPWIWLQPGAEDDNLKAWVDSLPDEDLKKRVIFGGPCILVEGEGLAKAEGKL